MCRYADLLNQYLPFIPCLSLSEPGNIVGLGGKLITISELQAWQMSIQFEWDEEKASGNEKKHGVTFEEARTIFNDPFAITIAAPAHSAHEDRWLDIGFSSQGRLLVVWYVERGGSIRIIGSRSATKTEERVYTDERQ